MKICPSCKTQYTDDSLAFCLQDGTRLIPAADPAAGTIAETETVARSRDRSSWQTQDRATAPPTPARKSSEAALIIAILAIVLIGFIAVIGVGAWLLWHRSPASNNTVIASNTSTTNGATNNVNRSPSPTPVPSSTPTPSSNSANLAFPSPTPAAVDPATVRRDVTQRVDDWKSAIESLNADAMIRYYAPIVDYYRRGPTSAVFVRNDKQRAFSRFNSIRLSINNLNVAADASGERATAEFDKEWVFEGARISTGKVRSQLRFAKINGQWLINSEKDLSVYYVN